MESSFSSWPWAMRYNRWIQKAYGPRLSPAFPECSVSQEIFSKRMWVEQFCSHCSRSDNRESDAGTPGGPFHPRRASLLPHLLFSPPAPGASVTWGPSLFRDLRDTQSHYLDLSLPTYHQPNLMEIVSTRGRIPLSNNSISSVSIGQVFGKKYQLK